jgi:hypothetical protein
VYFLLAILRLRGVRLIRFEFDKDSHAYRGGGSG